MDDQQLHEINRTLSEIKDSLGSKWWESILLVLSGALPSLFISWLAHKWTLKKEEHLFQLNKEKDERKVKAELVGKIKSSENDLVIASAHYQVAEIQYRYHWELSERFKKSPAFDQFTATLNNFSLSKDDKGKNIKEKMSSFSSLIAEYNYYVKDKEIDELYDMFKKSGMHYSDFDFKNLETQELQSIELIPIIDKAQDDLNRNFIKNLRTLVNHIVYQKK